MYYMINILQENRLQIAWVTVNRPVKKQLCSCLHPDTSIYIVFSDGYKNSMANRPQSATFPTVKQGGLPDNYPIISMG
jgi:hypothetical protein